MIEDKPNVKPGEIVTFNVVVPDHLMMEKLGRIIEDLLEHHTASIRQYNYFIQSITIAPMTVIGNPLPMFGFRFTCIKMAKPDYSGMHEMAKKLKKTC